MRLRCYELEQFARVHGYENGYELLIDLGCPSNAYLDMLRGAGASPDLVAEIYIRFGDEAMFRLIAFNDKEGGRSRNGQAFRAQR